MLRFWQKSWTARDCPSPLPLFGAGLSPARALSFANWPLRRPRASPAGWARVEDLEERLPEFSQDLKLHIPGCPNSCGQHWIADLGIEGKKMKVEGKFVDAYYFTVGGSVGKFASIARLTGYRCVASEVPAAIERLLRQYQADRFAGENLRQFLARHGDAELRGFLAGEEVDAVARRLAAV